VLSRSLDELTRLCQEPPRELVERLIARFEGDLDRHIKQVVRIVSDNVVSGRLERVQRFRQRSGKSELFLEEYANIVATFYCREGDRVDRLVLRDEAEWEQLWRVLAKRAYNVLLTFDIEGRRAYDEAGDFAQQACETIFQALCRYEYPYDVSFDAWATKILTNLVLKRHTRSRDLLDWQGPVVSLEGAAGQEPTTSGFLHEVLASKEEPDPFERAEVQEKLLQAIEQLGSQAQQQVIVDSLLHELSDEEIARKLGRSKQAVYNLRHRALIRLKQILTE
jgi:RNA polymerase sigma factor (sigma-70 family)